jgi:capsular polysaccharide transport system ATP-binding protein
MITCERITKSYPMGSGRKTVLRGIDLTIAPGEHVGLLGRNGAGKSTLIRLIGGVELPTTGSIRRTMSLSWPLGLSGGFQGSLTGYDNARFIARIYGYEYQELRAFIEDFSELGKQLKMPVKTYSAGMRARLGFALSLAINFDCYLIDEVIMVGDQNFFRKCHEELLERRRDRALIFATHSDSLLREFCSRAVVLNEGLASQYDDVEEALVVYNAL